MLKGIKRMLGLGEKAEKKSDKAAREVMERASELEEIIKGGLPRDTAYRLCDVMLKGMTE